MDPNTGRIYTPAEVERLDEETRRRLVYADEARVRKLVQRMRVKRKPLNDAASVVKKTKAGAKK
jgi:uncharacterized protein Smg (DUF494 family)